MSSETRLRTGPRLCPRPRPLPRPTPLSLTLTLIASMLQSSQNDLPEAYL